MPLPNASNAATRSAKVKPKDKRRLGDAAIVARFLSTSAAYLITQNAPADQPTPGASAPAGGKRR